MQLLEEIFEDRAEARITGLLLQTLFTNNRQTTIVELVQDTRPQIAAILDGFDDNSLVAFIYMRMIPEAERGGYIIRSETCADTILFTPEGRSFFAESYMVGAM